MTAPDVASVHGGAKSERPRRTRTGPDGVDPSQVLDIGAYLGRPEAWREFLLRGLVEAQPATAQAFCAVDGSGDC